MQYLYRGLNAVADVILPPQSLLTRDRAVDGIESELWSQINFLDEPCCQTCGFPFEYNVGDDILCGRCAVKAPRLTHIRSAFQYDDTSRRLILDFKHSGRTAGLSLFAVQLARAGRAFLPEADYLIPVPLHYRRRLHRRFNQSALLASSLEKHLKHSRDKSPAFDPDSLERYRMTETQAGKTAAGRHRNVRGAFRVRESALERVQGAHIVLIDDVMTTGATFEACAKCLLKAGAARVDGLALARVVKGAPLPT